MPLSGSTTARLFVLQVAVLHLNGHREEYQLPDPQGSGKLQDYYW